MNDESEYSGSPRKRRRLSALQDGTSPTYSTPATSLFNDRDDTSARLSVVHQGILSDEDKNASMSVSPRLVGQTVAPFLARHVPSQYAPLGQPNKPKTSTVAKTENPNTKYCYRHRPDLKCRRQADEPSMDQLQHVRQILFMKDGC